MKYAEDFRTIARDALRGKWPTAVLTGFIASLMGACIATAGDGGNSNSSSSNATTTRCSVPTNTSRTPTVSKTAWIHRIRWLWVAWHR